MTKDLEETLNELGPEYRKVVDRLQAACHPPVDAFVSNASRPAVPFRRHHPKAPYLLAASLLLVLGLGVLFLRSPSGTGTHTSPQVRVYTAAYAADAASLRAIVAAQRSDGSWQNDFLTRQNAAALAGATDRAALIAYKKAVRYLQTKGLQPLTESELRLRARLAATRS